MRPARDFLFPISRFVGDFLAFVKKLPHVITSGEQQVISVGGFLTNVFRIGHRLLDRRQVDRPFFLGQSIRRRQGATRVGDVELAGLFLERRNAAKSGGLSSVCRNRGDRLIARNFRQILSGKNSER